METTYRQRLFEFASVSGLERSRHELLLRAVANVLAAPVAKLTYAQIIDGLPLADVARDCAIVNGVLSHDHPLVKEHKELCAGVAAEAEELCSAIDVDNLAMPYHVRSC